jgi:hypothetical protein
MFCGYMPDAMWHAIAELSYLYRQICAKEISKNMMEKLEKEILVFLCKLEKIFTSRSFNPMQHLLIHIQYEAKVGGSIQYMCVGDIYPPGPLESERSLRWASGQLPRKAIPSWAGQKLLAEWADLRRRQTRARAFCQIVRYPKKPPDFPAHGALKCRGILGMSRWYFREISSVGSLLFRRHVIIMYVWSAPRSSI